MFVGWWGLGVVGVKGIGGWGTRGNRVKEVRGPGVVAYRSSLCTSHFIDLVCVDLDYIYGG